MDKALYSDLVATSVGAIAGTSNVTTYIESAAGIGAGVIGVGGAALLASLVLALDGGKAYSDLIMLLVISHIPVFIIDSIVSVGVVLLLNKMYPTALSVVNEFSYFFSTALAINLCVFVWTYRQHNDTYFNAYYP